MPALWELCAGTAHLNTPLVRDAILDDRPVVHSRNRRGCNGREARDKRLLRLNTTTDLSTERKMIKMQETTIAPLDPKDNVRRSRLTPARGMTNRLEECAHKETKDIVNCLPHRDIRPHKTSLSNVTRREKKSLEKNKAICSSEFHDNDSNWRLSSDAYRSYIGHPAVRPTQAKRVTRELSNFSRLRHRSSSTEDRRQILTQIKNLCYVDENGRIHKLNRQCKSRRNARKSSKFPKNSAHPLGSGRRALHHGFKADPLMPSYTMDRHLPDIRDNKSNSRNRNSSRVQKSKKNTASKQSLTEDESSSPLKSEASSHHMNEDLHSLGNSDSIPILESNSSTGGLSEMSATGKENSEERTEKDDNDADSEDSDLKTSSFGGIGITSHHPIAQSNSRASVIDPQLSLRTSSVKFMNPHTSRALYDIHRDNQPYRLYSMADRPIIGASTNDVPIAQRLATGRPLPYGQFKTVSHLLESPQRRDVRWPEPMNQDRRIPVFVTAHDKAPLPTKLKPFVPFDAQQPEITSQSAIEVMSRSSAGHRLSGMHARHPPIQFKLSKDKGATQPSAKPFDLPGVVWPLTFATQPLDRSQTVGTLQKENVPERPTRGRAWNLVGDIPAWVSPLYKTYGVNGPYNQNGPFHEPCGLTSIGDRWANLIRKADALGALDVPGVVKECGQVDMGPLCEDYERVKRQQELQAQVRTCWVLLKVKEFIAYIRRKPKEREERQRAQEKVPEMQMQTGESKGEGQKQQQEQGQPQLLQQLGTLQEQGLGAEQGQEQGSKRSGSFGEKHKQFIDNLRRLLKWPKAKGKEQEQGQEQGQQPIDLSYLEDMEEKNTAGRINGEDTTGHEEHQEQEQKQGQFSKISNKVKTTRDKILDKLRNSENDTTGETQNEQPPSRTMSDYVRNLEETNTLRRIGGFEEEPPVMNNVIGQQPIDFSYLEDMEEKNTAGRINGENNTGHDEHQGQEQKQGQFSKISNKVKTTRNKILNKLRNPENDTTGETQNEQPPSRKVSDYVRNLEGTNTLGRIGGFKEMPPAMNKVMTARVNNRFEESFTEETVN